MTQMCKTEGNSGYLLNKSRKRGRRRGGVMDDHEEDRQEACGGEE